MEHFFPELRMRMPSVDVSENEHGVIVEMAAPGIDPKSIALSAKGNKLHISGKSGHGMFERTVMLPAEVKGDEAKASHKDGVLRVALPKAKRSKSKRIDVKVE